MTDRTDEMFVKRRRDAHPDFFAAEAAGLAWLREGGAPVVDVLAVDRDHIALRRLTHASPDAHAARAFGAALARVHDSGADGFGSPPAEFGGQLFIGNRPMSSVVHRSWGEFYIDERVRPFVSVAVEVGTVTAADRAVIDQACELIASGAFDDDESPSRIHGDLWSGNVVYTDTGAVLIDPAAHGGHRETDLAMLALFGCPYLDDIVAGYCAEHEPVDGWRDRIPMHQLHPLAVHAAGHGRSYGVALRDAAQRTVQRFG